MSNQGFNLSTVKNSSGKTAEEGVDFITVTDGNGGQVKIMNLEHEMYAPREGVVEVAPLKFAKGLYGAIRHKNDVTFRCIRDKSTGWMVGVPMPGFRGKDKAIEWEPFKISNTEFFDLSVPKQRLKWICIKHSSFLKGSPNFLSQTKTVYEAVDRERQAEQARINRKSKRKALDLAESLVGEELIEMAIACGIDPKLFSTRMLEEEVVKFVEDPTKVNGKTGADRFLDIYYSESKHELVTIRRALSVGILMETPNNGISYNGVTLGFGEAEAVSYLRGHQSTLVSIDTQSRMKQSASTQAFEPAAPKQTAVKDEKDIALEKMKRENEELQARLAKLSEAAIEKSAAKDLSDIDPELKSLMDEAKSLGLKDHLIGRNDVPEVRKQKLRDKISEAKKKASN